MPQEKDKTITHPHLIVCEGLDAKLFLIYYLQPLIKYDSRFEEFEVIEPGGNDDIKAFFKLLPGLPEFREIVKSVTVIRDSEKNAQGASQSAQTLFRNNGFAVPSKPCEVALPNGSNHPVKVGYALFPQFDSEVTNGTLEDLCLNTLAHPEKDSIISIVDHAIESSRAYIGGLRRLHKNRLHTFLSLTDSFVGKLIGQCAQANAFDFSAADFEPLKALLSEILA